MASFLEADYTDAFDIYDERIEIPSGGWTRYSEVPVKLGKFPFVQKIPIVTNIIIPTINIYDMRSRIANRTYNYFGMLSLISCKNYYDYSLKSYIENSYDISYNILYKIYNNIYILYDIISKIPLSYNNIFDISGEILVNYNDTVDVHGKRMNINSHIDNINIKNVLDIVHVIDNLGE